MYSFINTSLKTCTCNYTERLHTLICRGTGVCLHTASSPWPLCPSIHYRFVGGCFMDINIYRQLSLSLHLLCVSGCGCVGVGVGDVAVSYYIITMLLWTHSPTSPTCRQAGVTNRENSACSVSVWKPQNRLFSQRVTQLKKKKKPATKQTCYIYCNSNRWISAWLADWLHRRPGYLNSCMTHCPAVSLANGQIDYPSH